MSSDAIEFQLWISLDEMIVGANLYCMSERVLRSYLLACSIEGLAYLYWPVTFADNLELDPLAALVQRNSSLFYGNDGTRLLLGGKLCRVREWEEIIRWNR